MTQARDLADGKFDTNTLVVDAANNRVGVGTTSPAATLNISEGSGYHFTAAGGNATSGMQIGNYDGSSYSPVTVRGSYTRMDVSGTEVARFTSNGLTFNGDTAAANALDDYEIGTFSPTLDLAGNLTSASVDNYDYIKIGNLVHVTFTVSGSVTNASNTVEFRITIPFNGPNNNDWHDVGVVSLATGSGQNQHGIGVITRGGTSFNQVNVYVQGNQVNATGTISTWLRGTLTYRAG